ncbi:protein SPEAR1-like [Vigna unguiculata]|uniref:Uncharacterized protein n=1 Tax=Vigna unguiculata TaxID=3917 RepID=A0A4D6LA14_VIGUN|nr:protein SPEAR1-like [Vigna unguiculata]QCD85266.1 hypothetical protein DEO72_LG2g5626 [Vigna unguiculata]
MDSSSYFGEPNLGNERSSASSSRKGKKNNSDKPKQPQRGLGVAQLEKIRLHSQMASGYHHSSLHGPYPSTFTNEDPRVQIPYSSVVPSSYAASYGFQPNIMMGISEYQKTNIRYGDSEQTNTARWETANDIFESQYSAPSNNVTRPFINLNDPLEVDRRKLRNGSVGSSSQNSECSDSQKLDLELRLSL